MICPAPDKIETRAALVAAALPDLSGAPPEVLERLAARIGAFGGCREIAAGIRLLAALKREHGRPPADVGAAAGRVTIWRGRRRGGAHA